MKKQTLKKMNAPIFGYWQALYMAFYSRQLYIDVGKRWKGIGFFYLLFMLSIICIPLSARLIWDFNQFVKIQVLEPLKTIPSVELHDGEIEFNYPMPYFVKSKTGDVVAMIDTRSNGVDMEGTYPELMLLITKDKFYFRPPNINLFGTTPDDSPLQEPIVKTPEKGVFQIVNLYDWVNASGLLSLTWIIPLCIVHPIVVSFLLGVVFTLNVFITMLAQVFSWLILKVKLKFIDAMRLIIVSSVVPLSVLILFLSANIVFWQLSFICIVLSSAYFSYAVLSIKRYSHQLARS